MGRPLGDMLSPMSSPDLCEAFRLANDQVAKTWAASSPSGGADGEVPVACECGGPGCTARLWLAGDLFARSREDDLFIVSTGHDVDGAFEFVDEGPVFSLVRRRDRSAADDLTERHS